jgi:hypothetical protein
LGIEDLSRANAIIRPSGDQTGTLSSPHSHVRLRCPLPSAFTTKISPWQTPHCPMAGPSRFPKANLSPSGDHSDRCTTTLVPTEEELELLRTEVDPLGLCRLEFVPSNERGELLAEVIAAEEEWADRLIRMAMHIAADEGD